MRQFDTGATRDDDTDKPDFEGFFSPLVLERRALYMHQHRRQSDGNLRDSDNWQKGMSLSVYIKSAWRHFVAWWKWHRAGTNVNQDEVEDALCALMFNAEGYLHELLKSKRQREVMHHEEDLSPSGGCCA